MTLKNLDAGVKEGALKNMLEENRINLRDTYFRSLV
jgi:hypothetical protein